MHKMAVNHPHATHVRNRIVTSRNLGNLGIDRTP